MGPAVVAGGHRGTALPRRRFRAQRCEPPGRSPGRAPWPASPACRYLSPPRPSSSLSTARVKRHQPRSGAVVAAPQADGVKDSPACLPYSRVHQPRGRRAPPPPARPPRSPFLHSCQLAGGCTRGAAAECRRGAPAAVGDGGRPRRRTARPSSVPRRRQPSPPIPAGRRGTQGPLATARRGVCRLPPGLLTHPPHLRQGAPPPLCPAAAAMGPRFPSVGGGVVAGAVTGW